MEFVIVNKRSGPVKLRQEYIPLSCLKEQQTSLTPIIEKDITIEEDGEAKLAPNKEIGKGDQYERNLVVTKENGASVDTLTFSLHGASNEQKLVIYPTSKKPNMAITSLPWYRLRLVAASGEDNDEAHDKIKIDDGLLEAKQHLHDLGHEFKSFFNKLEQMAHAIAGRIVATNKALKLRIRHSEADGLDAKELQARIARGSTIEDRLGPNYPRIALATSGGGMRAMVASCGFLQAMKESEVMDVAMYHMALSGSTWAALKWMNSETNPFISYKGNDAPDCWHHSVSPNKTKDEIDISKLVKIATSEVFTWNNLKKFVPELIESGSLLRLYSNLIGEKFDATANDYSTWKTNALSGMYPIPVCTSVYKVSQSAEMDNNLPWTDYTPFGIGSTFTNTFHPLKHFTVPEFDDSVPLKMCHFMAIWGSAFYADLEDIIPDLPGWIRNLVGGVSAEGIKVDNITYNRRDPDTNEPLPLANYKYLYQRDAGVISNLPMEPALRPERQVDIVVVFDTSTHVAEQPFNELVKAIPAIKSAIPKHPTYPYVFPRTAHYPTIVYIPTLKTNSYDPKFNPVDECSTFSFQYSAKDTTKLFELSRHVSLQAKDAIWQAINSFIAERGVPPSINDRSGTTDEIPEEALAAELEEPYAAIVDDSTIAEEVPEDEGNAEQDIIEEEAPAATEEEESSSPSSSSATSTTTSTTAANAASRNAAAIVKQVVSTNKPASPKKPTASSPKPSKSPPPASPSKSSSSPPPKPSSMPTSKSSSKSPASPTRPSTSSSKSPAKPAAKPAAPSKSPSQTSVSNPAAKKAPPAKPAPKQSFFSRLLHRNKSPSK